MILLCFVALVANLVRIERPEPVARCFCFVCGARFGGASALGHHHTMAHPDEDQGQVVSAARVRT